MARTSVKPERATVAHHGADVVTGVTALIRRGGDCFSWAIHFASRATPMAGVVSQPKHQDPSVWFAHRCVWAIYQPGGSDKTLRRRPQAAGKGYVPRTPAFRPGSRHLGGLGWTSANVLAEPPACRWVYGLPQTIGVPRTRCEAVLPPLRPFSGFKTRSSSANPTCRQNNPGAGGGSWEW